MHAQIILSSHQTMMCALCWLLYALMLIKFMLHWSRTLLNLIRAVFLGFFFLIICWDIDWGNYCCFIKVTPEPQRRSHHRPKPVKPLKWAPSLVILYFHVCSMVLSRHSHRRSENKILFCMQWCKRFERKTRVTSFLSTWWLCQTPAGVWGPAEHLEDTKLSSDVSFYISCWYSCLIISQCSWNITAKIYKSKFIKKI